MQLQRMLDEDPKLVEICSTNKAVDVMRRFRVEQSGALESRDMGEDVQATTPLRWWQGYRRPWLRSSARSKAWQETGRRLNGTGLGTDLNFDEVETLRVMSQASVPFFFLGSIRGARSCTVASRSRRRSGSRNSTRSELI